METSPSATPSWKVTPPCTWSGPEILFGESPAQKVEISSMSAETEKSAGCSRAFRQSTGRRYVPVSKAVFCARTMLDRNQVVGAPHLSTHGIDCVVAAAHVGRVEGRLRSQIRVVDLVRIAWRH